MGRSDGTLVFDTKIITDGFKKGITALGVSVGALSGAVLKLGSDFEASAAKATTLFGQVAVDTANLNNKILELSSSSGLAATELNEALYSALSSGIPVTEDMAEATGFLESAVKLAKAGFTDTDTAVSATAKTLNAYGMDVSEAERIQGILIQTQNKGITTVNELGASLAQVTPTAAAFSVSFENVGAALATMTAMGTPTAQATTQLNQLIAELGKNGTTAAENLKKAAAGTEYAGQSFKEMMENGASLSDVLSLIQRQADKNGVSMVDMFSSIEAGKAALSIASGEAEKFNANFEAMNDTAGLVEEGYEKMMNTLEGQTDKFVQSAKNLGISVYEGIKGPITEAVKAGNESLEDLQKSLSGGEMKSALTEAGALIGKFISVLIKLATAIIPPLIDALGFLGDNIGLISTAFITCTAAVKLWQASAKITAVVRAIAASFQTAALQVGLYTLSNNGAAISASALSAALSVKEIIVGVLTGKIHLLTAAQALLNKVWAANPVGVVVAGVVALTAAIVALSNAFSSNKSEAEILTARVRELGAEVDKAKNEFEQLKETQEENISESESHFTYVQKLADELNTLADETGKVADKDKARAKFIITQLNEALGTEYEMTGNQIERYQELRGEIDELIKKKRAEAMLSYMEPAYERAVGRLEKQKEHVDELTKSLKELEKIRDEAAQASTGTIGGGAGAFAKASADVQKAQEELDEAIALQERYQQTFEEFEAKYAAALDGNYEALYDGTWKEYIGAADGINAAAEEVAKANKNFEKTLGQGPAFKRIQSVQQANGAQSAEYYTDGAENYFNAPETHSRLYNATFGLGQTTHKGYMDGEGAHSPSIFAKAAAKFYVEGAVIGLKDNSDMLYEAAKELGGGMNAAFENSITSNLDGIRTAISSITGVIKEESEQKLKVFEAEQQKIEMLHDFGIDDEETYYNKLEWLRDNYLTKNSDKWIEVTQELYDYQESQLEDHRDKIEDIYDDIADHVTDKLEDIAKKQQKFSEKLSDSTPLYQKVKITAGDETTEFYRLTDFAEANKAAAEYGELLEQISSRIKSSGISDEVKDGIISELESLGRDEDGIGYIKALLSANDSEFEKYLSGYATLLGTNNATAANMYYDDAVNAANEGYQYMIDEFTKAGLEIPEGFLLSGELSAENFGRAFMDELDLQMQEIQKRLTDFNAQISASVGSAGNVNNDNRSTTYHIYGGAAKDTVKEIENYETVKRLSGQ